MKYLKISNDGEINPLGLSLMGASVKSNEKEAIGSYGSGFKYSIASMLRNNIAFKVFKGTHEIEVKTQEVKFDDKTFNRIFVDGEATSLTTEMGVGVSNDWDTAFPIFREIYSNAIDGGNPELQVVRTASGISGSTSIFIEYTENFAEFFNNFNEYFSHKVRPLMTEKVDTFSDTTIDVLPKGQDSSVRVFRRGILAFWRSEDNPQRSIFNYNSNRIKINESRVASNTHSVKRDVGLALCMLPLNHFKTYITTLKGGNSGYFEHECIPYEWATVRLRPEVVEYLKELTFLGAEHVMILNEEPDADVVILPFDLIKIFLKEVPELKVLGLTTDGVVAVPSTPSPDLEDKVIDAITLLKTTSYASKLKGMQIEFVKFASNTTLGAAKDGKVMLSTKLDSKDVNAIARVILEEVAHLETGFSDSTRSFQDYWIDVYFNELIRNSKVKAV